MSSFLCFICHSTVNSDTNEETREKYREVVGMHLCPDSHLCYICCHVLNKLWLFKSICLKRSLEYPVLFSEKGTINVRRNDIEIHTLCPEETCEHHQNRSVNYTSYHFSYHNNENHEYHVENNQYVAFDEGNDYTDVQSKSVKEFQNDDLDNQIDENFNDFEHSNVRNDFVHNENYFHENQNNGNDLEDDHVNKNELNHVKKNYFHEDHFNKNELNHVHKNDLQEDHFHKNELNHVNKNDLQDDHFNQNGLNHVNKNDLQENCVNEIDLEKEHHVNEYDFNDNENDFINTADELLTDSPILEQDDNVNYDTNHGNQNENIANEETKKKKKSKKCKKKGYKKIILNLDEQKAELEAERKNKQYLDAEFKCYNCALGFLFKDTYQTHMLRHEESNGEFRCETCSLRFATSSVLRSHVLSHSTRYLCTLCGSSIKYRHRLQHSRRCHEPVQDVVACHLCGNVFQDSNGLQHHLRRFHKTKTSNKTYPCSVCGKNYNNQAAVRTHMLKHINRKFNCDQCTSTFSSPYTLNQHRKKHIAGEKELFHCTMCNTSYNSRKSLLAHKRSTMRHQQTVLECPICNRVAPNRLALSRHVSRVHMSRRTPRAPPTRQPRTHTNTGTAAVCHLCGRGFKTKSKLNRHLREVCEKQKLEEELSSYYEHQTL